jgi:hypothetical protein
MYCNVIAEAGCLKNRQSYIYIPRLPRISPTGTCHPVPKRHHDSRQSLVLKANTALPISCSPRSEPAHLISFVETCCCDLVLPSHRDSVTSIFGSWRELAR